RAGESATSEAGGEGGREAARNACHQGRKANETSRIPPPSAPVSPELRRRPSPCAGHRATISRPAATIPRREPLEPIPKKAGPAERDRPESGGGAQAFGPPCAK